MCKSCGFTRWERELPFLSTFPKMFHLVRILLCACVADERCLTMWRSWTIRATSPNLTPLNSWVPRSSGLPGTNISMTISTYAHGWWHILILRLPGKRNRRPGNPDEPVCIALSSDEEGGEEDDNSRSSTAEHQVGDQQGRRAGHEEQGRNYLIRNLSVLGCMLLSYLVKNVSAFADN